MLFQAEGGLNLGLLGIYIKRNSCLLLNYLQMNGAAFPSPTAEIAEMNRIHYELQYTEGISQRMRVPEMLKVAPYSGEEKDSGSEMGQEVLHTAMMHVPERIIVAGQRVELIQCESHSHLSLQDKHQDLPQDLVTVLELSLHHAQSKELSTLFLIHQL